MTTEKQQVTKEDARTFVDAVSRCLEARQDERDARGEETPYDWGYFGARYFDAIDRCDEDLARIVNEVFGGVPA